MGLKKQVVAIKLVSLDRWTHFCWRLQRLNDKLESTGDYEMLAAQRPEIRPGSRHPP
jgi:hypothetical protein